MNMKFACFNEIYLRPYITIQKKRTLKNVDFYKLK